MRQSLSSKLYIGLKITIVALSGLLFRYLIKEYLNVDVIVELFNPYSFAYYFSMSALGLYLGDMLPFIYKPVLDFFKYLFKDKMYMGDINPDVPNNGKNLSKNFKGIFTFFSSWQDALRNQLTELRGQGIRRQIDPTTLQNMDQQLNPNRLNPINQANPVNQANPNTVNASHIGFDTTSFLNFGLSLENRIADIFATKPPGASGMVVVNVGDLGLEKNTPEYAMLLEAARTYPYENPNKNLHTSLNNSHWRKCTIWTDGTKARRSSPFGGGSNFIDHIKNHNSGNNN